MKGDTGVQTMNGYVSLRTKEHRFSVSQATGEAKQRKAVPCMEDNRALIDEQLNLLETIRGENTRKPVSDGVIQGRIPNFTELDSLHERLSVDVIREKVSILLGNLQLEGLILLGDGERASADRLIKPDGKVDKTYYEELFGKADGKEDKEKVYHDVKQTHIGLKPGDEANLKTMLSKAQVTVTQTIPCEKKLQEVFGNAESKDAKNNYIKVNKKLSDLEKNLTTKVTTDYNGDDRQLGIGGYANFGKQEMHIMQNLCENVNDNGVTTTIHECAHLVDNSIKDYGYMGTSGFEFMAGDRKVNNAAHYEVIPSWILGASIPYPVGHRFVPYNLEVGRISELDFGKKDANDFFESAWSVAVNLSLHLRGLYAAGNPIKDTDDIMEKSRQLSLTIHQHTDRHVSLLDVTLMQDMARTLAFMMNALRKDNESVVTPGVGREIYKFHFINKIITANLRQGITPSNIRYLYSLAYKK